MSTISDDAILDARDMQAEIDESRNGRPRTFEEVINEWTEACLRENRNATLEQIVLIMRLGVLGQRLLYEANQIGVQSVLSEVRGR